MKKNWIFFLLFLVCFGSASAQSKRVLFTTDFGNFEVVLFDFTPRHRDLFIQSIQDSAYQHAFFNRVIKDFVVQGGEHDIDIAEREKKSPETKKRFPAEIDSRAIHKTGAFGQGRDDNPEKASFLHQIYFVVGKTVTAQQLDEIEKKKGIKYTPEQREMYIKGGGQPRLDGDFTVFGEVASGFPTLMKISQQKTDSLDYPVKPIPFQVKILK